MNQNPCSNHEVHMLFEHEFYLTRLKMSSGLYDVTQEIVAAQTAQLVDYVVCENVALNYDIVTHIMTFECLQADTICLGGHQRNYREIA